MREPGETLGLVIAVTVGAILFGSMIVVGTGHLGDVAVFVLGRELLDTLAAWATGLAVLAAVVAAWRWSVQRDRIRIHYAPHRDTSPGGDYVRRVTIPHEAHGHAAVASGVKARGIRARAFADGSGWVEASRRGLSLAESLAITVAGEMAGGSDDGCGPDRARFKRDLRRAPARYRAAVKAEAIGLAAQHIGNAFGHQVERALLRTGRFR